MDSEKSCLHSLQGFAVTALYSVQQIKIIACHRTIFGTFCKTKEWNGCNCIDPVTAETVPSARERTLASRWSLLKTFNSILEIFWLFISSWTRRPCLLVFQVSLQAYFKCLCKPRTVEQPEGIAKLSDFVNKSKHKDAQKLNCALMGMVMAQLQISVPTELNTVWKERTLSTGWIRRYWRSTRSIWWIITFLQSSKPTTSWWLLRFRARFLQPKISQLENSRSFLAIPDKHAQFLKLH